MKDDHDHTLNHTLNAMIFALALYLMLVTIVLYVRACYKKDQIINRLTLRPFAFVMLFCVCQMLQTMFIEALPRASKEQIRLIVQNVLYLDCSLLSVARVVCADSYGPLSERRAH